MRRALAHSPTRGPLRLGIIAGLVSSEASPGTVDPTKKADTPGPPARGRLGLIAKRLGQVVAGLGVGLLLAEGIF